MWPGSGVIGSEMPSAPWVSPRQFMVRMDTTWPKARVASAK